MMRIGRVAIGGHIFALIKVYAKKRRLENFAIQKGRVHSQAFKRYTEH
jgi:hypothetical protein